MLFIFFYCFTNLFDLHNLDLIYFNKRLLNHIKRENYNIYVIYYNYVRLRFLTKQRAINSLQSSVNKYIFISLNESVYYV